MPKSHPPRQPGTARQAAAMAPRQRDPKNRGARSLAQTIKIEHLTADYNTAVEDPQLRSRLKAGAREWGFCVLTDYYSAPDCDALVSLIDQAIETRPEIVRTQSDKRIIGADVLDPRIDRFHRDPLFEEVGEHLIGEEQKSFFSMANRLEPGGGQPRRSGGYWHRDRMAPQFKSMVYLSDVSRQNGPFCLFPKSNTIWPYGKACQDIGFDFFAPCWDPETFSPFYEKTKAYLKIFLGRKGTVVLFDSSNIHSGLPIETGRRYAITNYYYEKSIDIKTIADKFSVGARPIVMPAFR